MSRIDRKAVPLATGITLNVAMAGPADGEPILFLHGFPESHRTWRHQLAGLADRYRVYAPDQRGFAASDRPEGVENYETDRIVADVVALADALGLETFTLAGHDWGGAVAWTAALTHPVRVKRLIIVNAPHPLVFQKSLIDDPARLPAEERQHYLDDWSQSGALTAMLNWYRASKMVVPEPGEEAKAPLWTHAPFPKLRMPILVVWGLKDTALLPVQLDGLNDLIEDLRLVTSPTAGHFITWEEPGTVTSAIRDFMAETA
jgi:pimeloyl-ACP methyl ester carboxylesterase